MGNQTSDLYTKLLNYDGKPESFQEIMNNASWWAKKRLGEKFQVWYIACLYKFLKSQNTDMSITDGPDIISQFKETEARILQILKKSDNNEYQDLLSMLYLGCPKKKYLPYLKTAKLRNIEIV